MTHRTLQLRWVLSVATTTWIAGCAGLGGMPPEWQEMAVFATGDDQPRIVVYGSLARHLPQFEPTPGLDEFLYGPTPVPNAYLRNPQGLVMLGHRLLVCDQGYPDIISVNLVTGISAAWEDQSRAPRCPVDIAVEANGMVYVADTTLRAVLVYLPSGGFVEQLIAGDDPARFRPASLLVHEGVLYVGNLSERRVERWSIAGREWLSPITPAPDGAGFVAPTGLAMTHDGILLIVDSVRGRVFRLASDGVWLAPLGRPGREPGEFVRPKQICISPSGMVFVADAGRQSVMVFRPDGGFVTEIREQVDAWRGFTLPTGLLALPGDALDALFAEDRPIPEPRPDEWVVVTDTLGGASLNLLGVFLPGRGEPNAAD